MEYLLQSNLGVHNVEVARMRKTQVEDENEGGQVRVLIRSTPSVYIYTSSRKRMGDGINTKGKSHETSPPAPLIKPSTRFVLYTHSIGV